MNETVTIRHMTIADTPNVVRVHLQSFKGFFLSFLGEKFLYWLYRSFLEFETGVALVAEYRGEIIGVVAGTTDQSRFYKLLLRKRWHRFAAAAVAAMFKAPGIIWRLLRAVCYPRAASQAAAPALLMSLAAAPTAKGFGIGYLLLQAYLAEMAANDVAVVSLTTDRDHNEDVNRFYRKQGFELQRCYTTPEGRVMNEYVIHLNKEETPSHGQTLAG